MSMDKAIKARLSAVPGVTALVGSRVYPMILPQKPDYPAITYQQISGGNLQTLTGPSGIGRPRMQIDCWANSKDSANAVANQVRLAFDGWKGVAGGIMVRSCSLDQVHNFYEPATKKYRVSIDFNFQYDEEQI